MTVQVRYGEVEVARARSPFEARLEALVGEVAAQSGRPVPRPDARLGFAAEELARRLVPDGRPPSELVQAALWLHGVVEPPPHLVMVGLDDGAENALVEELRAQLPKPLGEGRFRRVGVAVARTAAGRGQVVIALGESFIELEPITRELPAGAEVVVAGRLVAPYRSPEAFVTGPDGKVAPLALDGGAEKFRGAFRCGPARGRYQLEVAGEDKFGAAVLANFPIFCGVAAPRDLPSGASSGESFTDAASAEKIIFALVNADRARAGLPALALDARLSDVSRAHSADMSANHFLGHISPSTGSAADRLRRARIDAQVVLENVARAYSPGEAERGLMDSPGHRANLLSREVERVGVGVVIANGLGGVRELFVTQVFTRPTEVIGAGSRAELRKKIDDERRASGAASLLTDAALDALAQSTAAEIARGALAQDRAGEPIAKALPQLAEKYAAVKSVVAVSGGLEQIAGGLAKPLTDRRITACGIGLAQGKRPDGTGAVFAVIVLATGR